MHHDNGTGSERGRHGDEEEGQPAGAPAHLRRMYVDCRYGQLHVATAYPSSGGFDEASPIVFLHAEDGSGADFQRCAALLGGRGARSTRRTCRAAARPMHRKDACPWQASRSQSSTSSTTCACAASISSAVGAARLVAFELAATRPQEVRRLIVAGTQQPGDRHRPADARDSRPIPAGFSRSRPKRSSPRSAASSTASSRARPRADAGMTGGRDQDRRQQRQRRVVEPLPADRRHRESREQRSHCLRAEHQEVVQRLRLDSLLTPVGLGEQRGRGDEEQVPAEPEDSERPAILVQRGMPCLASRSRRIRQSGECRRRSRGARRISR